jgi:hypothetical protein
MLLSYGADPNIKVIGDGTNTTLRPPLAELLASNENISLCELHLLLKHGARCIMKTQFRDPDGLLNCLTNITKESLIFDTLLDAAEEFDPCMIRRTNHLSESQRKRLLDKASQPLTLKAQTRAFFRKTFTKNLPEVVPTFFVPQMLRKYLLYEHN